MKNVYKNIFLISMHKLRFADVYFYIYVCLFILVLKQYLEMNISFIYMVFTRQYLKATSVIL